MNEALVPVAACSLGALALIVAQLLKRKERIAVERRRLDAEKVLAERRAALLHDRPLQIEEANRLLREKQFDEALPYYARFVEESSGAPHGDPRLAFCYPLALCYIADHRLNDAVQPLMLALTYYQRRPHPDGLEPHQAIAVEADIHSHLAKECATRGDNELLRFHARLAAERFAEVGNESRSRASRGLLREKEGAFQAAADDFGDAIRTIPADAPETYRPELLYARASNLFRAGSVTAAIPVAIEAWQAGADRIYGAHVPLLIARCYGRVGKFDEANGYIRRAEQMVTGDADMIAMANVTAAVAAYQGRLSDSLTVAHTANANRDQVSPVLLDREARALAAMGRFPEASKAYRSLVKLASSAPEDIADRFVASGRYDLAEVLCEAGEFDEAVRMIEATVKLCTYKPWLKRATETLRLRIRAKARTAPPESVQAAGQVFLKAIDEEAAQFADRDDGLRHWHDPLLNIAEALLDAEDTFGCRAILARFDLSQHILPWARARHHFLRGRSYELDKLRKQAVESYRAAADVEDCAETLHATLAQVRLAVLERSDDASSEPFSMK